MKIFNTAGLKISSQKIVNELSMQNQNFVVLTKMLCGTLLRRTLLRHIIVVLLSACCNG